MLISYIKRQYKLILMLALFAAVFASVFSLYDLPAEAVFYSAALCLVIGLVLFSVGYRRYLRTHRELKRLLENVEELSFCLPPPQGALEADYQALVRAVCRDRARIVAEGEDKYRDMLDYYTLWAHQIKTPVAAMSLLLQTEGASREALGAELLKIEQYVEMVLTYLRLGSDSTDYVLRRCSLDEIVRACARRYARLFVLKKLSLRFDGTGRSVLTDEKWLSFVVGQLLSNAIKYTPEGGEVRVYGDGQTLVVSDTGIGIREEDLPRVFEKGFTGQNGRQEKKSTGIGLYLCRRILDKLGGSISIVSRPGKGTIVRVLLPEGKQVLE
ncbi:sensor histidine kinase [Oscillibacter hominis]|uniref:histidine kinase n=1 Tax=Oscillibacter hominis TaxID=2763056 RepID=A0A7G9B641_9FIRM|nr:sensor histidine kinase [Oscillibacter hominis]QNL45022.1 sensor histidine kinase [Oscillibacter hominis]